MKQQRFLGLLCEVAVVDQCGLQIMDPTPPVGSRPCRERGEI